MEKGIIPKLLSYYFESPEFKEDLLRAFRSFFNKPNLSFGDNLEKTEKDEEMFNEWLVFDFKLKNRKTLLEDFCQRNPYNLSSDQLQSYKELQSNEYGIFEVLEVKTGEGLKLRNLRNEKQYWVKEYRGTLDLEKGELIINRVGKAGDHLELVGSNSYKLPKDSKHPFLGSLVADPKLNPKKIQDFFKRMDKIRKADFDVLKDKLLDGGGCVCDICGKKGKMGSLSFHKKTGEPMAICQKCNLKMLAQEEGITQKEAERRRKKMFDVSHLFQNLKMKEYLDLKNKKGFDSLEYTNQVLERIIRAWNNLSIEQRKGFEEMNDQKLKEIYKNIPVDFSNL